jgi:hypothetical protein
MHMKIRGTDLKRGTFSNLKFSHLNGSTSFNRTTVIVTLVILTLHDV